MTSRPDNGSTPNNDAPVAVYYATVRHHWRLIAAVATTSLVVALAYSAAAPKRYEARADILVSPVSDEVPIGLPVVRQSDGGRGVVTVARLISTAAVAEKVADRLGSADARSLLDSIKTRPQQQSGIVSIVATSTSPGRSVNIANGFADTFMTMRKEALQSDLSMVRERLRLRLEVAAANPRGEAEAESLSHQLVLLTSLVGTDDPSLRILARATVPESPVWPRPLLSGVVALIAGAFVGAGAALLYPLASRFVWREEDLTAGYVTPILARVSLHSTQDVLRLLRARLARAGADGGCPRSVLVLGTGSGQEQTTTALGLAMALASGGQEVVLVDATTERRLSRRFANGGAGGGLGGFLKGNQSFDECMTVSAALPDHLTLLLARPRDTNVLAEVSPAQLEGALAGLAKRVDVVVIDGPGLSCLAGARFLADVVEATLVVVPLGATRKDELRRLRDALDQIATPLSGFVIFEPPPSRLRFSRALRPISVPSAADQTQTEAQIASTSGQHP